nr:Retrovirus-related Pol polyprotein from transposon TNT 1-94 [Ipomoea batatas]
MPLITASAPSNDEYLTKPKSFETPDTRSITTFAWTTSPYCSKAFLSPSDVSQVCSSNKYMASDNFVQPAIPRFDGHYDHWSMLMENFLRSKELWIVVETAVAKPTADMSADQRTRLEGLKLKDLKAKNYLFQAIDRSILETILSKDSSKNIWDSMKKKFKGNTKAKRLQLQALRSEYETLRMKEGEKASEFVSKVMALVSKLQSNGDQIDEAAIVEKILRSMTPKYNFVVCAIEEGNDTSKMTLDELESSLFSHEQKLNLPDREADQALKASVHDRSSSRGNPHDNNEDNLSTENVDIQHEETDQNIPVHSPTAVEVDDSRPRRAIRRPAWMSDYEVTRLHSEDLLVHLALFSYCDPAVTMALQIVLWHCRSDGTAVDSIIYSAIWRRNHNTLPN